VKKPTTSGGDELLPTGLRRYLYGTAALTGAAIMIVEILGAKMLSPYIGTSHFVWTAQIAVTLVALASGYYLGGRLVDRSPRLSRLYWCILAAAAYLVISVPACPSVAYATLQFDLAAGSLLASAFLFFVPLCLLAMVGPFVVRVMAQALSSVGGTMGRLTAVSTLGSVVGTLLIGYALIPLLPNSMTMYLTAALLVVASLGYFLVWGRGQRSVTGPIVLGLLVVGPGWLGARPEPLRSGQAREIYRANSDFGLMQVLDLGEGTSRLYLNDYLVQNTFDTATGQSTSLFTYMLHGLAQAYASNISEVLCIGLGVGIVPMQFAREGKRVDVIEINPRVAELAERFFNFEPALVHLTIGDGRYYLNRCRKQYDVVVLDAFLGDSSPSHLMTQETFREIHRLLRPGGVLVINSFGNFEPGRDFFTASLHKTLRAVFPSVKIHSNRGGNVFFVASDRPELAFVRSPLVDHVHPAAKWQVESCYASIMETHPDHGMVLTDDFNPVEFHDARNREEIRRNLAFAMRSR